MRKHPALRMLDEAEALAEGETQAAAPAGGVADFVASMPRSYRDIFDAGAVAAHAAIVQRRGALAATVHVELWREDPQGVVAVCVVVDDRPGLLSRISAAFVSHDIDVVGAQAYCRKLDEGRVEAVDFFWVRRISRESGATLPTRQSDLEAFARTLEGLLVGRPREGAAHGDVRYSRHTRTVRGVGKETRVRFEHREPEGLMVLTVEGQDRPGLLLSITEALFRERVQIVRSEVSTNDGRILDRFHMTEIGGAPLQRARLLGLQTAVLGAIEESLRDG